MQSNNPADNPNLVNSMFTFPIPGHSLTHEPKSQPWEHPPKFVHLDEAMKFLMHQMLEPHFLKQLLMIMNAGMSIEAITRTIIMAGFANGQWTPTLGMLIYKPLMLSLIAIAKKAGLDDTPIAHPGSLDKHNDSKFNQFRQLFPTDEENPVVEPPPVLKEEDLGAYKANAGGFFTRRIPS